MDVTNCVAGMLLDIAANIKTLESNRQFPFTQKVWFAFPLHLLLFQKFWNFWLNGKWYKFGINYHGIPWLKLVTLNFGFHCMKQLGISKFHCRCFDGF